MPTSAGDWLWVSRWSCGCVRASGIAWVFSDEEGNLDDPDVFTWITPEGNRLGLHDARLDYYDGKPEVDLWLRMEMPPKE